jgi:hypothetical protein
MPGLNAWRVPARLLIGINLDNQRENTEKVASAQGLQPGGNLRPSRPSRVFLQRSMSIS